MSTETLFEQPQQQYNIHMTTQTMFAEINRYINFFGRLSNVILHEFETYPYRSLLDLLVVLLLFWYLFHKSRRTQTPNQLTKEQADELIEEWQPEPIVPPEEEVASIAAGTGAEAATISQHEQQFDYHLHEEPDAEMNFQQVRAQVSQHNPQARQQQQQQNQQLQQQQEVQRFRENNQSLTRIPTVLDSVAMTEFSTENVEGKVTNFGTFNFLGFSGHNEIIEQCKKTIERYGVGSCGPRGFYGSIDVHLDLEERMRQFMNTEACILYSFGFCTVGSVIPAFSKRGDILVVDNGCNHAVKTGVHLSRSITHYFDHNDMSSLEQILNAIVKQDKGETPNNRRFIVIQGVYENSSDMAPLRAILELKKKYCFRVILDDSFGLGVLGKTGRGTIEHCGLSTSDFEIVCANLENAFASVGGVCVGSRLVVEHQRLSGAAYCFSASLPPYLSKAAIESMNHLDAAPDQYLTPLQQNIQYMRQSLLNSIPWQSLCLKLDHADNCPIFHIRLNAHASVAQRYFELKQQVKHYYFGDGKLTDQNRKPSLTKPQLKKIEKEYQREHSNIANLFQTVVKTALFEEKIAVACPKYTYNELVLPDPSIRITVSANHTSQQIEQCCQVLVSLLKKNLK